MSRLFAIGDLHLSKDPSVDKPMDVFGPAWQDHEIRVEEAWKATVSPEDTVILAGDLSWALHMEQALADLDFIDSLPGRKICIKGNHDLWWHGITKMNQMYEGIRFLQNDCAETDSHILCGTRGWICPGTGYFDADDERIYRRELLRLESSLKAAAALKEENGKPLIGILHYPPTNDRMEPSGFTDLMEAYGVEQVVYGHLHGKDAFPKGLQGERNGVLYRLVSLDYLEATPVLIAE